MPWGSWTDYKAAVQPMSVLEGDFKTGAMALMVAGGAMSDALVENETLRRAVAKADKVECARLAAELIGRGEVILMMGRFVMAQQAVHAFLSSRQDDYSKQNNAKRMPDLIQNLIAGCVRAFREHGKPLTEAARGLPPELRGHFRSAADLLLLGEDELSCFSALRGFEATLRAVIGARKIQFQTSAASKARPLSDATYADVVEASTRLRWGDKKPLVDRGKAQLLHYLRLTRNSSAHLEIEADGSYFETAIIAARASASLWSALRPRRTLTPKVLVKDW